MLDGAVEIRSRVLGPWRCREMLEVSRLCHRSILGNRTIWKPLLPTLLQRSCLVRRQRRLCMRFELDWILRACPELDESQLMAGPGSEETNVRSLACVPSSIDGFTPQNISL